MTPVSRLPLRRALGLVALGTAVIASPASAVPPPFPPSTDPGAGEERAPFGAAGGSTVTVLVAGDIASCDSNGDLRTARIIASIPGTVMTAGDNAYPSGTPRQYRECYHPTWGQFRDRTRPTPGNHDWATAGADGYFGYFGTRAGRGRRGYYAFDLGGWRIYALTSDCWAVGGCGRGSRQLAWLKADLAANPHSCVMAVWHHPRFSSGYDAPSVTPFLRALHRAGAELVVNGHDHRYERFAPARPDGTPDPRGIRQFVVGTGGADLYPARRKPAPHSEVRNGTDKGVLRLNLSEGGYAWRFLSVRTNGFTDAGTGTCH